MWALAEICCPLKYRRFTMGLANSLNKYIEPIRSESVCLHGQGAQQCGWLKGDLYKWIGRWAALKCRCKCKRNSVLQNSSDDIQLTSLSQNITQVSAATRGLKASGSTSRISSVQRGGYVYKKRYRRNGVHRHSLFL